MEHIRIDSDKLEKLKVVYKKPEPKKGIHNEFQEATWEACQFFKEPKRFGQYYGYITKIGVEEARKRIALQKEQGIRQAKFFFKKI